MAYPEAVCLRNQTTEALVGKEIAEVSVEDIAKFSFEGGSCYTCPGCQPLDLSSVSLT